MAKKKTPEPVSVAKDLSVIPAALAPVEPDRPVSVERSIREAGLREPLEPGEVIREDRSQIVTIDGAVYHHVRDARDGRWIYAPLKSAGQ